jgi:hypothetical protein
LDDARGSNIKDLFRRLESRKFGSVDALVELDSNAAELADALARLIEAAVEVAQAGNRARNTATHSSAPDATTAMAILERRTAALAPRSIEAPGQ